MRKVIAFLMIALFTAGVAFAADAPAPEKKFGTAVGDFVKPVEVKSVDGKLTVKLDQIKKKSIFVLVSSVCSACRTEVDDLKANAEKLKEKADIFVVIIDMDPSAALARMGEIPFPTLADPDYKIGSAGNLMASPSTLIVENGKIMLAKSGYQSGSWKEFFR